jgi:hypothetical protein
MFRNSSKILGILDLSGRRAVTDVEPWVFQYDPKPKSQMSDRKIQEHTEI